MTRGSAVLLALTILPASLTAQHALDPAVLRKPAATDAWPTYHGDYSSKRYSTLDQINRSDVGTLTLAWAFKALATADTSTTSAARRGRETRRTGEDRRRAIGSPGRR